MTKKNIIYGYVFFLMILNSCNLKTNNVEEGLRPASTGAIYINNQSGHDKNPGTIKKPVKTIAEINKRIKNAVSCRDRSQTRLYMFAGEQEFEGTLILNKIHGIDSIPISIGSYGRG